MSRPKYVSPSRHELKSTTSAIVAVVKALGLECCLFGGQACALYGAGRLPCDVDVVILGSPDTQEAIKDMIVQQNSRFRLVAAKDPANKYRVLWYKLGHYGRHCKVDILIPGLINIPPIPSDKVVYKGAGEEQFPVMPFILLLLMKLQGWEDHKKSTVSHLREKQYVDVRDLGNLLTIGVSEGHLVQTEEDWLPEAFMEISKARVVAFVKAYGRDESWRAIGFDV